jgi:nuclear transport factor 2 (NTF2) superfamily protein
MSATPTSITPPFTLETALAKVQAAEDAWNTRDPERVALAYPPDSQWRNGTRVLAWREQHQRLSVPEVGRETGLPLQENLVAVSGKTEPLSPLNNEWN